MNTFRTGLLLAALTGLFLAVGYLIAGEGGMAVAFVLALAMNLFAYWNSDKVVLRIYGAREVGPRTAPELARTVAALARNAGLPVPRIYVIDSRQPNAFATGRDPDHAAVAVTTGLLEGVDDEELAGVLAHELAHVRNRDTLTMTVTATIAGAVSMLANFALFFGRSRNNPLGLVGVILVVVLAPLAAMLVQAAISRTREFEADRIGAEICGRPLWLASALARIEAAARRTDNLAAERNPATAHLFIVNPLHGRSVARLFSTHPDTAERVRRLRELAGEADVDIQGPARGGPWG